jgi:TPR repeat protein
MDFIHVQKGTLSRVLQNVKMLSALLSPAAEAGLSSAQYILGLMFQDGEGVDANPVEAVEWCKKGTLSRILQNINTLSAFFSPAAEAGHVEAQFNLGASYHGGFGVEANQVKAVEWYQKGILSRILLNVSMLQHVSFASRRSSPR